jgi:hypothetical protein
MAKKAEPVGNATQEQVAEVWKELGENASNQEVAERTKGKFNVKSIGGRVYGSAYRLAFGKEKPSTGGTTRKARASGELGIPQLLAVKQAMKEGSKEAKQAIETVQALATDTGLTVEQLLQAIEYLDRLAE